MKKYKKKLNKLKYKKIKIKIKILYNLKHLVY